MKKHLLLLLLSTTICFAVSCGGNNTPEKEKLPAGESDTVQNQAEDMVPAETDTGYTCVLEGGICLTIGAPEADMLSALGDPLDLAEAPSCIHEGMDRICTYDGFSVTTSPDADGVNRIYEIALLSDAAVLEGGLTIGSAKDAVTAVFGEDYTESFGVLRYAAEGADVSVILDGNECVTSLVITALS